MAPIDRALDSIDAIMAGRTDDAQQLIRAKCRALMVGYDHRWRSSPWKAIAVEQIVESGLTNPLTNRDSRTFTVAGKLDVIAEYEGKRYVIDHKTTSQSVEDPASPFWRQLVVEAQPSHYMLLEWQNGRKLDGAMWDVIRKPAISPRKLGTKAERASIVAERTYYGQPVGDEYLQRIVAGEDRESIAMYEARLRADVIDRPEWYYARQCVPRLDHEMLEYAEELWDIGQEIANARKTERHYRNSGACLLYNSPCEFLGICSGHDSPDSDKWVRRQSVHEELDGLSGDGRNVLTNSRLRCFQTCRKRHFFKYELGIERFDAEEREALWFGTVLHAGLQAWWESFLPEVTNGNGTDGPLNAGGQWCNASETTIAR